MLCARKLGGDAISKDLLHQRTLAENRFKRPYVRNF
jgi:hypothetical protein